VCACVEAHPNSFTLPPNPVATCYNGFGLGPRIWDKHGRILNHISFIISEPQFSGSIINS